MDTATLLKLINLAPAKGRRPGARRGEAADADDATAGPMTQLMRAKARNRAGESAAGDDAAGANEDANGTTPAVASRRARDASVDHRTVGKAADRQTKASERAEPEPADPRPSPNSVYSFGHAGNAGAASAAPNRMPSLETIARDFPHVLQKLRAAWSRPREFDRVISELLVPDRPGRLGFPPQAALELSRLREYYAAHSVAVGRRVAPAWPDTRRR